MVLFLPKATESCPSILLYEPTNKELIALSLLAWPKPPTILLVPPTVLLVPTTKL